MGGRNLNVRSSERAEEEMQCSNLEWSLDLGENFGPVALVVSISPRPWTRATTGNG